jgi:hypothetical protein
MSSLAFLFAIDAEDQTQNDQARKLAHQERGTVE